MKIEIKFDFDKETKNNYVFKQAETEEKPIMFPPKIYLNKSLFKKQPTSIMLEIVNS